MIDYYKSQLDRIQDLVVDSKVSRELIKEVIVIRRQLIKKLEEDLDQNADGINIKDDITTVDSVRKRIISELHGDIIKATTTYIPDIDRCWRWRQGEVNVWTGYGNEGKSTMLNFLTLIKCLKEEGSKAAIFSPENYPPTDFYMDMIHTILGRIPQPEDQEEVEHWLDVLNQNIFFVYPRDVDFTPDNIFKTISSFIELSGVNICILDPYLKLHHKLDGLLEHQYIGVFMSKLEAFTRRHNLSMHLVAHQLTPQLKDDGNRPKPSGYKVKGGGSFYDGTDNMLIVQRPNYEIDKHDPSVVFESSKIKKHKIVAKPNSVNISFDLDKNRYISQNGLDMFDLAMGKIDIF